MNELKPGEIFERRYRIVQELGRGSFATVYLAENVDIAHRVAIKLLHTTGDDLDRFVREAAILAELSNPHVIRLLEFGRLADGTTPYMIFEYVEGEALRSYLEREGKLEWREAVSVIRQCLSALADAHRRGIVHRDMKPANVMITSDGTVKVLDFGVAKLSVPMEQVPLDLTGVGAMLGTPRYMAPESIKNAENVTAAADIFSVGVMAWWLVTGEPLDWGKTARAILQDRLDPRPYELPGDLDIPIGLRGFIHTLLRKDPGSRPPNGEEALADLERCLAAIGSGASAELDTGRMSALRPQMGSTHPWEATYDESWSSDANASGQYATAGQLRATDWYLIAFVALLVAPGTCLFTSMTLLDDAGLSLRVTIPLAIMSGGAVLLGAVRFIRSGTYVGPRDGGALLEWLAPWVMLISAWVAVVLNLHHVALGGILIVCSLAFVGIRFSDYTEVAELPASRVELAVGLVALATGIGGMLLSHRAEVQRQAATEEGREVGTRGGAGACIRNALQKHAGCPSCDDANAAYLLACVEASADVKETCQRLPARMSYSSSTAWGAAICERHGRGSDFDCGDLIGGQLYSRCAMTNFDRSGGGLLNF